MAEALYRKYRPQVFSDVVGQDHIERTLKNAIEQDKVSHAYLFCGPRGTGKTTTARLVAKALLCENGPTSNPDGTCPSCMEIANGEHPDVYELDAASRTGVDNVREEIIGRVQFAPTRGRYKVYIIDEVHMLSTAAFNALLKTLEEPPGHVVFILCTTDPQKVPETILSRCQRFDFRRIASDGIAGRLAEVCQAEGVSFEKEALEIITRRSDGGLRNALTALEQAIAFGNGTVTVAVVEQLGGTQAACDLDAVVKALAERDMAACFGWVEEYAQAGGDIARLTADLAQRVRDMYFLALAGVKAPLSVGEEMRARIISQAKRFAPDRLAYMLTVLGDTMVQLKSATNGRLCFEIALTKICRPASDLTLESLAERVEALEKRPAVAAAAVPSAMEAPVEAPVAAPVQKVEPKPELRVEVKPEPASAAKPEPKPESKPEPKPELKPEPDSEPKPEPVAKAEPKSEPQPVQQIVPAPATDAKKLEGFDNPALVQRTWQRAFAQIKKEKPAYGSILMGSHVRFDKAQSAFVLSLASNNPAMAKMIQKPEALEVLSRAASQAAGTSVAVFLEGAGAVPVAAAVSASAATPASQLEAARQARSQSEPEVAPAAKPEPKPEPRPESNPESEPQPVPDATTSATPGWNSEGTPATPDYAYEEVPADAYDSFVDDYDWEDVSFDEPVRPQSQPKPEPQPKSEPARAVEAPPWEDDPFALPEDVGPIMELNDFEDMLRSSFGAGVVVEEM